MEFNSVAVDSKTNLVLVNEQGCKCLYEGKITYQTTCSNIIVSAKRTVELNGLVHEGDTFKGYLIGKGSDYLHLVLKSNTEDIQDVYDVVEGKHIVITDLQSTEVKTEVLIFNNSIANIN